MFFKSCPIGCGSALRGSGISLPEGELLRCPECGQLLSQADEAVYNDAMQRFESHQGVDRNPRAHLRRLGRLRRHWHVPPQETRVLDVGCSFGTFLSILQDSGYMAEGVEPSDNAAAECLRAGLKVHHGLIQEAGFDDGSFDVVTMYEVIEHLPDPTPLIQECHRVLRRGGMMFLSTGNARSWTARVMKGNWDYFSMLGGGQGHISFFNPLSITLLAEAAGFRVEAVETRAVRFVHKGTHTGARYVLGKIAQEALGLPAKLLGSGHEMLAVLRK